MKNTVTASKLPKWKTALAVIGVIYLVGGLAYAGYKVLQHQQRQQSATNLAANPEQEAQIVAERKVDSLDALLNLSPEQSAALAIILEDHHERMLQNRSKSQDRSAVRSFMETERKRMMAALEEILDAEQMTRLEKLSPLEQMSLGIGQPPRGIGGGRGSNRGRNGGGGRERMQQVLEEKGLTQEEVRNMSREERRQLFREMGGPGAGREQGNMDGGRGQGPGGSRGGGREQMQQVLEEKGLTQEDVSNMSREERRELFGEMSGPGGGRGQGPMDGQRGQRPGGPMGGGREEMQKLLEEKGLTEEDLRNMSREERQELFGAMGGPGGGRGQGRMGGQRGQRPGGPMGGGREQMQKLLEEKGLTEEDLRNMSEQERQELFEELRAQAPLGATEN